MIAPDADKSQQAMSRSLQASAVVTIYAAAMRFQVSPLLLLPLPSWYGGIKDDLETAIEHARHWQDSLCGQVAIGVPQGFVDFNSEFSSVSSQLINLMTQIEMSGAAATDAQRAEAVKLTQALLGHLDTQVETMNSLHAATVAFMDQVQQDHTDLVDAESTIAAKVPDGGTMSKHIQAELGNDFLDTQMQGTCSVSLSIKESIDIEIKRLATGHEEILPYVIALQVLAKAQTDNEAATKALSDVLTQWQFLQNLTNLVVADLREAENDKVLGILRKLDVQKAQQVWAQIELFAKKLLQTT